MSPRRLAVAILIVVMLLGVATAFRVVQSTRTSSASSPTSSASSSAPLPVPEGAVRLRGRILDANGDPVAGAHVRVMVQARVVAETLTEHAGRFAFGDLVSGSVRVEADHDPEGAVRSAPIFVSTTTPDLTLTLAVASVRGVVVDAEDGHPIANATLSVEGVPFKAPSAMSDPDGSFHFTMIPFEATSIVAVASGYRGSRVTLAPREGQPEPALRIELRAGASIDGDVVDPDGKPLRAQIIACEGQAFEARIESADDGTFRIPPSTVGCDVFASHDEMAPSDVVQIVEGHHTTLRLRAGGGISGSAVDDQGAAIDSFSVGVEAFVPLRGAIVPAHGTKPFTNGVFRLEHLMPGTYVLTASKAGRPPVRSRAVVVRSGALTDGVKIVITQGGTVVGRVLDDQHAPLAGANLHFESVSVVAGSDAVATTDSDGRYRLEGAPSGPFTLHVDKGGYRDKLVAGLWVAFGQTITKDITLTARDGGAGLEL